MTSTNENSFNHKGFKQVLSTGWNRIERNPISALQRKSNSKCLKTCSLTWKILSKYAFFSSRTKSKYYAFCDSLISCSKNFWLNSFSTLGQALDRKTIKNIKKSWTTLHYFLYLYSLSCFWEWQHAFLTYPTCLCK